MSEKIGHLPPFGLRIKPDLKARIQEVAARERRSLNWIITEALEREFPHTSDAPIRAAEEAV